VFVATGFLDGRPMFNDVVIAALRETKRSELDLGAFGLGRHRIDSMPLRRGAVDRLLDAIKYLPLAEREQRAREIAIAAGVAPPVGLMLDRASVRLLAADGIAIGAHSVNHPILANTPADAAWREISESKRELEEMVGAPVTLFAYPNGKPGRDYASEHVRMVRDAGYAAAVSTAWGAAGRTSDVLQLPRFTPWSREPLKFDLLMLRNLRHGFGQRAA
jgi:peptidoglycan/xylan/chitin deacetylase (PgdA/CDA1 family)